MLPHAEAAIGTPLSPQVPCACGSVVAIAAASCVIFLYGGAPRDEKEQSSLDSLLLDDSRIGCVR